MPKGLQYLKIVLRCLVNMSTFFRRKYIKYLIGIAPLVFFVGLSFYLSLAYSPEIIVGLFGVKNAYALIFIMAIFSGLTTSNVIPYHVVLITLVAGGLNPYLAGSLAAIGVTLGDSTSYYIGFRSRAILPEHLNSWFESLYRLGTDHPRLFILICFLYGTIAPGPNDLITMPGGLAKLPFWRLIIPLALGNVVFDLSLALLAVHAFELLQKLPFF